MSRYSAFDSPLLLGFDRFEEILDRASKAGSEGYPPYNIEQVGESHLRITLAVAGFSMDDLSVTEENSQLVIRGRISDADEAGRQYLHRGIAARQFQRSFVLAEGIEVRGAEIDNGLLHIDLIHEVPEPEVRTIPIKGHATGAKDGRSGGPGSPKNQGSPKTINVESGG